MERSAVDIDWRKMYDDISKVLTDYEGMGNPDLKYDPDPLYVLLCDIQNYLSEKLF